MKERRSGRHVSEYPQTRCILWRCDSVTDIIACFNLHIICIYYFPFLSVLCFFPCFFLSLFLPCSFLLLLLTSCHSSFSVLFLIYLSSVLSFFLTLLIFYIHTFSSSLLFFSYIFFLPSVFLFVRFHIPLHLSKLHTDAVPIT